MNTNKLGRDVSAESGRVICSLRGHTKASWVPRELGAEPQVLTCTRQRKGERNEGRAEGDCNMAREGAFGTLLFTSPVLRKLFCDSWF